MKDAKGKGNPKGRPGNRGKPVPPVPPVDAGQPDLKVVPRRPGLLAGRENRLEVLVRLPCPPPPEGRDRPPLNLAYVLDRSGSMDGHPLVQAKRCVAAMASLMGPRDRASLVVYDNHVQVVLPSTPVTSPALFQAALAGIESGGSTDLHGGWLAGAKQVADHLSGAGVSRVILLSDGNANTGLQDPDAIEAQVRALAGAGVTTSTYGLGVSFNEDLMVLMARAGGGSGYYGETADHLMEPFRAEFDLMSALLGRGVRLDVKAAPWATVRLLNDYVPVGPGAWLLPELAWGGETWALLEVATQAPPADLPAGRDVDLLQVTVSYRDADGKDRILGPRGLEVPLLLSGWDLLPEDPLVAQRAGELAAAGFQRRAREAAGLGDWDGVDRLLRDAHAVAARNPWVQQVLGALADIAAQRDVQAFRKEAHYAARQMSTRRTHAMEDVQFSEAAEAACPSFLRRKTRQGRTQYDDGSGSRGPGTGR